VSAHPLPSHHPQPQTVDRSSGVVPPGRNATRTSNVQHPTSAEFPAAAYLRRLRHWQPYDPHTRIAFGETVRAFQSLLPFLAASSPSRLFAEQRRPTRTELASNFSDIALRCILTCDSLPHSIALVDHPKVESLPRSFHANFLELKWTFCEHRYQHDDRSIRKQIRSSNSIPSSILLCESLSSYRHRWLPHAVITPPCCPHRPSRSDSHSQLEHCKQRGIGDDIQGHSGRYSHAGQQCARRKQIAKIYCRQP
jgi:hypothetical protein